MGERAKQARHSGDVQLRIVVYIYIWYVQTTFSASNFTNGNGILGVVLWWELAWIWNFDDP